MRTGKAYQQSKALTSFGGNDVLGNLAQEDNDDDEDGYHEGDSSDEDGDYGRGYDVDYRDDEEAYIADYDDHFKAISNRY